MAEITNEQMASLLVMLEANLEIFTDWMDADAKAKKETELSQYIESAISFIEREGINLDLDDVSDDMLVTMYANYLYDKRKDGVAIMPRVLRYNLNNRLFQEKLQP